MMKRHFVLLGLLLSTLAAAQSQPGRVPAITAPGQVQPVAPGTRPAPQLPQLRLTPPLAEVRKVETLSNGFITAAHALVLVPGQQLSEAHLRDLALKAVERTFGAKPNLAEVDVSVYRAETYRGFGGPSPLLTLSVPRARLAGFPAEFRAGTYDRLWMAASLAASEPELTPLEELERLPVFIGTNTELLRQKLEQSLGLVQGGVRGGLLFRGNTKMREVALTFDDAPHPLFFPLVLDVLRREHAHATFFVIGRNALAYPYFIRDAAAQGHELANHTFHHVRLPHLSDAQITKELQSTNDLLQKLTGQPVRYFRPPGGEYSPRVLKIAEGMGLTTVFWTDDPGDFQNPGVETVEARYTRHLRPGGIILLHDNAPDGLLALPDLLKVVGQRGFTVDTVGAFRQ